MAAFITSNMLSMTQAMLQATVHRLPGTTSCLHVRPFSVLGWPDQAISVESIVFLSPCRIWDAVCRMKKDHVRLEECTGHMLPGGDDMMVGICHLLAWGCSWLHGRGDIKAYLFVCLWRLASALGVSVRHLVCATIRHHLFQLWVKVLLPKLMWAGVDNNSYLTGHGVATITITIMRHTWW